MTTIAEEWRPVLGYEGWYEASSEGRVRCIKRGRKPGCRGKETYPIVLTPLVYRKGYIKYALGTCDGEFPRQRMFAHRIVYEAFHGPIPPNITVNHIDGIKDNCAIQNLELATHAEQNTHARKLGLLRWRTANGHATPRLTKDDVAEIRRAYQAREATYEQLAERYGVVKGTIWHILNGRSWKGNT